MLGDGISSKAREVRTSTEDLFLRSYLADWMTERISFRGGQELDNLPRAVMNNCGSQHKKAHPESEFIVQVPDVSNSTTTFRCLSTTDSQVAANIYG